MVATIAIAPTGKNRRNLADETPVILDGNKRLVLHVVPVSALDGENRLDPRELQRQAISKQLISFGSAIEYRTDSFNIDGLVISSASREPTTLDYLQVFSSGVLETADVNYVNGGEGEFPTRALETRLLMLVPPYLDYLRGLGFAPPFVVSLSLLGVKGLKHAEQREIDRVRRIVPTFDRDVVNIPEVLLDAEQLIQPVATYSRRSCTVFGRREGVLHPRYREDGTYDPR